MMNHALHRRHQTNSSRGCMAREKVHTHCCWKEREGRNTQESQRENTHIVGVRVYEHRKRERDYEHKRSVRQRERERERD